MRKVRTITVLAFQAALCFIIALLLTFSGSAFALEEFGVTVDFDTSADLGNFVYESGNGTWTVSDGRLNAKNYSVMVTEDSFDTTAFGSEYAVYVSFDMYGASSGGYMDGANDYFDFVLADKEVTDHDAASGNMFGIKMRVGAPNSYFANNLGASAWVGNVKQNIEVDKVHNVLVTIIEGKATFSIDGTVLSNINTSETQFDVPSNFKVAFRAMSGSYIDNFKVYKEIREDAIINSDKDFSKLDKYTSLNTNNPVSALSLTGEALKNKTMASRLTFWLANYSIAGADYFAVPVNNATEFETGVAVDLKEGENASETGQGRWWTAAESTEYYLESADGTTVYGGKIKGFGDYNQGYAKVPANFNGNVIFPIESFEILDWAANTLQYDNFTDDANAFNLEKAVWADVYYYPVDSNANEGTFSFGNPFIYGAYIPRAANSANRVITAINGIGNVTAGSEKQIAFARAQYEALSSEQKAQVDNIDLLTTAERTFKTLDIAKGVYSDGKDFTGTEGVAFEEVFTQSPRTVAAWIRVNRDIGDNVHIGTVIGNNYRRMYNNAVIDDNNTFSMEVTTNGNPKFEWRVSRTQKVSFVVKNVDVRTGRWLHIAFTADKNAGKISCYINGELAAVKTDVSYTTLGDLTFDKPVMIGSDYTNEDVLALSFTPDFNGYIAQARVYSNVINATEITDMMNGETLSGLMGGVDFISGEEKEYYGYSGNNASDAFSWKAVDLSALATEDGEFTVAVMGDTQMLLSKAVDGNGKTLYEDGYTDADNFIYKNAHWLVENKDTLNLQLVSHMGDLTDFMNYSAWETKGVLELEKGLSYMDYLTTGGVKWIMNRGNHDGGFTADRLAKWDEEFSAEKYASGVTGNYNEMRNAYYTFTVGEVEYMYVVLDLEPTDDDIAWAKGVIDANPDARVVVTTHAYMDGNGQLISSTMGDASTRNSGVKIWEKLINVCPNIVMVLCGHCDGIDITQGAFTRTDGSTVKTFMIDSSTMEFTGSRQTGVMAFMKFAADGKTVSVNYYSPTEGKLFRNINQFTFELDLSYFEDDGLELDFSSAEHGSYFTKPANANGNFVVNNDALYPAVNWAVGVYNQPISLTGTYNISLDFHIENNINFFIGLVDGINSLNTSHNVCFAYLGSNKNSYIYNDRLGLNNWKKTIDVDYADGNIHAMTIDIVNGVVTFAIDGTTIGTYNDMIGLSEMYLAFHSADTYAYVDNLNIKHIPQQTSARVIYDNYGDAVFTSQTDITGALPQLEKSGHVFIGYKIDGELYPAGYSVDTLSDKTVVAVFARFTTFNGASVRVSEPSGIRFTNYLDKNVYNTIGSANISLGTILAHAEDITVGSVYNLSLLTLDNLEAYNIKNLPCTVTGGDDNYLAYNGAIVGIQDSTVNFAARGYMTVSYADGSSSTFYAGVNDNVRSLKSVAEKVLSDVCSVENDGYNNKTANGYSSMSDAIIELVQGLANA